MKTRAAIAFEAGKTLEVLDINLDGPKTGEVMIETKATGVCHSDAFTLSAEDPEGTFPAILGHEEPGQEIATRPFLIVTGRSWHGVTYGGARGRTDEPTIVEKYSFSGDLLGTFAWDRTR